MGHAIVAGSVRASAPSIGLFLGDIAEGSIVNLNENGNPVEFYVACHNYESTLNGSGRTLLVRKDCYDIRAWNSSGASSFSNSEIDTWLNGTYKALFDADVKEAIGTTKFYYVSGVYYGVSNMQRSIFLLTTEELGYTPSQAYKIGSEIPTASKLKVAYKNGTAVNWWTRKPYNDSGKVYYQSDGGASNAGNCTASNYSRPCFTLPSLSLFDEETMLFKGVA